MGLWNQWPTSKPREIIDVAYRVTDFDRSSTIVDSYGNVKAKSKLKPYGFLSVETPASKSPVKLPIIHRDDFLLATFFFDDPNLTNLKDSNTIELLVSYSPYTADKRGFSITPHHCLHYAICKFGSLEKYYSNDEAGYMRMAQPKPELLFGPFNYTGELKIYENLDPTL